MDNSLLAIRKMNSQPATSAGAKSGATIRRNRVSADAPQIAAADVLAGGKAPAETQRAGFLKRFFRAYHDDWVPPAGGAASAAPKFRGYSLFVQFLPYVEQDNAYKLIPTEALNVSAPSMPRSAPGTGGSLIWWGSINVNGANAGVNAPTVTAARTKVKAYDCPSDGDKYSQSVGVFIGLTITGSTLRARPIADKGAIAEAVHRHVWPLLETGAVKPIIHATFPLRDASEAHRVMESSTHIGKLVLIT
jgi:hypothetical protein